MDRDINVVFLAELSSTKGGLFQAHDESVNKMAGSHHRTGAPYEPPQRIASSPGCALQQRETGALSDGDQFVFAD